MQKITAIIGLLSVLLTAFADDQLANIGIVQFEPRDIEMLRSTAANAELFHAKSKSNYSDRIIYRGTGIDRVLADADVIDLFFTPNSLMTADSFVQRVVGQSSKTKSGNLFKPLNENQADQIAKIIPDGFKQLIENPIELWKKMVAHKNHSDGSPFLSSTLEKYIAKKFARGKKSTIIITARLPNRGALDVERIGRAKIKDLPQLLTDDAEVEVMLYGAIAPDSIIALEYFNPVTEKTTSYLRDPKDPSKIDIVDGPLK
jgi:hypothetical protein